MEHYVGSNFTALYSCLMVNVPERRRYELELPFYDEVWETSSCNYRLQLSA